MTPPPVTLDEIRDQLTKMSAAKRAVGDFIVHHWRYSAFLNAAQLAAESGVSESVVVRFAKDLGFRGYPELQETIRNLLMEDMGILDLYRGTTEAREFSIDRRIEHSLESDVANLTHTMRGIDPEAAEAAAKMLISARQIVIVGSRSSRAPASVATIYLNGILGNARHYDNANSEIYDQLRSLDDRDVVLAFVLRHYNRDTVSAVKFAHERGAKVVTVTDSPECPLVPYSEHSFYAQVTGPSFYVSHVATIGIVNLLLLLVATLGDSERQASNLADLEQIYDSYYYSKPIRGRTDPGRRP